MSDTNTANWVSMQYHHFSSQTTSLLIKQLIKPVLYIDWLIDLLLFVFIILLI